MTRKQGTCGGTPKRDGSGRGIGNRNTVRQPKPSKGGKKWQNHALNVLTRAHIVETTTASRIKSLRAILRSSAIL